MLIDFVISRDSKRAQDTFLETQKDKPIGQVFDTQFRWGEMLDAVADVYIGVSPGSTSSYGPSDNLTPSTSSSSGPSLPHWASFVGTFRSGTWVSPGTKSPSYPASRLSS